MTNNKRSITFTVHCQSLLQAAEIEECLEKIGIKDFTFYAADAPAKPAKKKHGKPRKHHVVSPQVKKIIRAARKAHPEANIPRLKELTKLPHSASTFGRILGQYK